MKQKSAPQGCAKAHSFFADCPTAACLRKDHSKKDGQADAYVGSDKRSTAG